MHFEAVIFIHCKVRVRVCAVCVVVQMSSIFKKKKKHYKTPWENLEGTSGELIMIILIHFTYRHLSWHSRTPNKIHKIITFNNKTSTALLIFRVLTSSSLQHSLCLFNSCK